MFFFFFFITYAAIKDISDKNLGVKFTGILSVLSQSFEKTPQTFNLGAGYTILGKMLYRKYRHLDIPQVGWSLSDTRGKISDLFTASVILYSAL